MKLKFFNLPALIVALLVFGVTSVSAQNKSNFNKGAVIIGNDTTCDAGSEGAIKFGASGLEVCRGVSGWQVTGQLGCADNNPGACQLANPRVNSDPSFIASNIKEGVNIMGVTGTRSVCQLTGVSFTDVTSAPVRTVYTSNTVTVSGITVPCYVVGVFDFEGSLVINGVDTASTYATVSPGDTIALKMKSPTGTNFTGNAKLYSGNGSLLDTWSITTINCPAGTGSQTFSSIGTHTYTPTGTNKDCTFTITVRGAGGGGGSSDYDGGPGGGVTFKYATGGSTILQFGIYVGEGGKAANNGYTGGAGGGGNGTNPGIQKGAGGGGASAIKWDTTVLAVAGGGGGSGGNSSAVSGGAGAPRNASGFTLAGGNAPVDGGNGGNNNIGGDGGGAGTKKGGLGGSNSANGANGAGGGAAGGTAIATHGIAGGGGGGGNSSRGTGGGGGGAGGGGGGGSATGTSSHGGGGGGGYVNQAETLVYTGTYTPVVGGAGGTTAATNGGNGSVVISWGP